MYSVDDAGETGGDTVHNNGTDREDTEVARSEHWIQQFPKELQ